MLTPEELEHEVERVLNRLEAYYTSAQALIWMTTKHPQLHGTTALMAIKDGYSDVVHRVLDRLDADAYL